MNNVAKIAFALLDSSVLIRREAMGAVEKLTDSELDALLNLLKTSSLKLNLVDLCEINYQEDYPMEFSNSMILLIAACRVGRHLLAERLLAYNSLYLSKKHFQALMQECFLHVFNNNFAENSTSTILIIHSLERHGFFYGYQHNYGNTSLIYYAASVHIQAVAHLLTKAIDVNHKNESGVDALFHAVANNNTAAVSLLLAHGADPFNASVEPTEYTFGGNSIDIALKRKRDEIYRLLIAGEALQCDIVQGCRGNG